MPHSAFFSHYDLYDGLSNFSRMASAVSGYSHSSGSHHVLFSHIPGFRHLPVLNIRKLILPGGGKIAIKYNTDINNPGIDEVSLRLLKVGMLEIILFYINKEGSGLSYTDSSFPVTPAALAFRD